MSNTNQERTETRVRHEGPLTLSAFKNYARVRVFRPAKKAPLDPLQMGWEVVPGTGGYRLTLREVTGATAEGLALLATTLLALEGSMPRSKQIILDIEASAREQAAASGLSSVAGRGGFASSLTPSVRFNEALGILPVCLVNLRDRSDCLLLASQVSSRIAALLQTAARGTQDGSLSADVRCAITEVLTNVYDHTEQKKVVICARTMTGSWPGLKEDRGQDQLGPLEENWILKNLEEGIVEISIADADLGIPARLYAEYLRRHPRAAASFEGLSSGTNRFARKRAKLHTAVVAWAFEHDSSSKKRPVRSVIDLSWRGLHRCQNHVVHLGGMIALRSGLARVGHVANAGVSQPFAHTLAAKGDLPGTIVTIRLPIRSPVTRLLPCASRDTVESWCPKNRLAVPVQKHFGPWESWNGGDDGEGSGEVAVLHPFRPILRSGEDDDDRGWSLECIRRANASLVSLHLFTDPEAPRENLIAYVKNWTWLSGSPRLVAFCDSTGDLTWTVAGEVPEESRAWIHDLLSEGVTSAPEHPLTNHLARELARNYPNFISMTQEGNYRLTAFNARPDDDYIRKCLQESFERCVIGVESECVCVAEGNEIIRLTSGRLVGRYFSVTALVDALPILRRTMGFLTRRMLTERLGAEGGVVVVPSPASRFLLRMLLREQPMRELKVLDPGEVQGTTGPYVIFVNAIHTGETVSKVVKGLKAATGNISALTCIDMRRESGRCAGNPVDALLRYRFDPGEWTGKVPAGMEELDVCRVTDWPVRVSKKAVELWVGPEGENLVKEDPLLFDYGLHKVANRIHVVTLPVGRVVARRDRVVQDWCITRILRAIQQEKSGAYTEVVIVAPRRSNLYPALDGIATELVGALPGLRGVSIAEFPEIPEGRRATYARPGTPFLSRVRILGTKGVTLDLFSNEDSDVPRPGYTMVFIDNSAISGRTIRAFISSVVGSGTEPGLVMCLPVLSRLSPTEEGLFRSTRRLRLERGAEALFYFDCMFRLQVKSFDGIDDTAIGREVQRFSETALESEREVATLLSAVVERLGNVESGGFIGEGQELHVLRPPLLHEAKSRVTTRAILFRHLLALHQQNHGVLPYLLEVLQEGVEARDYSYLSVIGLEPDLLDTPPLSLEGWDEVVQLASHCLRDEGAAIGLKSDAISVLARRGDSIARQFPVIVQALQAHPQLFGQVLLHLGVASARDAELGPRVRRLCEGVGGKLRGVARRLAIYVTVSEEAKVSWSSADERAALDHLIRFFNAVFRHSAAYSEWRDVNRWLQRGGEGLGIRDPVSVVGRAVTQARGLLLPCFPALAILGRGERPGPTRRELRLGWERARFLISETERLIASDPGGLRRGMGPLWAELRHLTVTVAADESLGATGDASMHPGLIERALADTFSAPIELLLHSLGESGLQHTDGRNLSGQSADHDLSRELGGTEFVVARAPVRSVLTLWKVLLENFATHGEVGTLALDTELATGSLKVCLRNIKAQSRTEGSHTGLGYAENLAKECRAELSHKPIPIDVGEQFWISVEFKEVWVIPRSLDG